MCALVFFVFFFRLVDLFDWPRLLFASLRALISMQFLFFLSFVFFFASKPLRLGKRRGALASRAELRRLSALVQLSPNGLELHE